MPKHFRICELVYATWFLIIHSVLARNCVLLAPLASSASIFSRSSSALLALMASVSSGAMQLRPVKPPRVRMGCVDAMLVLVCLQTPSTECLRAQIGACSVIGDDGKLLTGHDVLG